MNLFYFILFAVVACGGDHWDSDVNYEPNSKLAQPSELMSF
jgi:hypothetical protein